MPRKHKLTENECDRKDQREFTAKVKAFQNDSGMQALSLKPPTYLRGVAKKTWRAIAPALNAGGLVVQNDSETVASFCIAVEMIQTAYADVQKNGIQSPVFKTVVNPVNGEIISKDFTGYRKNPAVQTLSDNIAKAKSLSNELGLTPQSRASLLAAIANDDDDDDESLSEILSRNDDDF